MRIIRVLLAAALVPFVAGLTAEPTRSPFSMIVTPDQDSAFEAVANRYVDEFARFSPVDGTRVGDHRHDTELDDMSESGRNAQVQWERELLDKLGQIDRARLSRANQVDAAMLANGLRYDIWLLTESNNWAWDPLLYNSLAGNAIYSVMSRDFAPLRIRLKSVTVRLRNLHRIFDEERANLIATRVPPIFADQACERNRGVLRLIEDFVKPYSNALDGTERDQLLVAINEATLAINEQQRWIEYSLVPKARGNFRVGRAIFDAHLALALQSHLGRAEIRRRAQRELRSVREDMYGLARQVLAERRDPQAAEMPKRPSPEQQQHVIEAALALAALEHPARDGVVDAAKGALKTATDLVRARNLVSVPSDPIQVVLMPEFQRGFSVAYCDSPGPLDVGQNTFFAISPVPESWDDAKVTSFLQEYNTRGIEELTFHEAMPGHYLQLAASNRYPSKLRSMLRSETFVEGWAVYAERLMSDEDGDPLLKLVNRKFYLRAIVNALVDQGIHTEGMTRKAAMHLMVHDAFQEEREAAGKWQRAQLSSGQLSTYFVGMQEHLDLRHEAERRWGTKFNLHDYHDRILSYGSPPVSLVRELLFELPIKP